MEDRQGKQPAIEINVSANGYLTRPLHDPGTAFLSTEEMYTFESFHALVDFLEGHLIYRSKTED